MSRESDASRSLGHAKDFNRLANAVLRDSGSIGTCSGSLQARGVTGKTCSECATGSREARLERPDLPHDNSNNPDPEANALGSTSPRRLLSGPSTPGKPPCIGRTSRCSGKGSSNSGLPRPRSGSCPQIGECHEARGYSTPGGPGTAPASPIPGRVRGGSHCHNVDKCQIATCCCLDQSASAQQEDHPWNDCLDDLPNEVLLHIMSYLEVCDLLATSRTNHHLRDLSLSPILHSMRLRRIRTILPPLLLSPSRPTLPDLIGRRIFMTQTTVVSRKLSRSLISIRLSRRLAARPSPEALVARGVLPPEWGGVAPALVAKKRAVEKERVKDGLRGFVERWTGEAKQRGEGVRRWEESRGVGRVWRLKRFWERVARGDGLA
ncbi:hypothetical protein MCOR27_003262 [Pyricularia oryzae]|uniref:F-box domain-containing protein n=2 Tax=Pyricularia TaxID=48558 RepID=A0ABQ8NQB3_PYRGI|nr:hypothetical protein MCOR01_011623 [Pyricularia oryzae]KAI6300502.1 hypothetical protein MCOR33_003776 [Pyricularia grisea]KAH9439968.1 hypothetical protein MCOR02_003502 [Pyricularia oryzae]KAI6260823.1 hypothetical protein MCOR19_002920 [Pyricularia oryzae]KAI6268309.1 hypothetical protein MCOR26_009269 [Pyricularia oryzae]